MSPRKPVNICLFEQYRATEPTGVNFIPHQLFEGGEAKVLATDSSPLFKCISYAPESKKEFIANDGTPLFSLEQHKSRKEAFTIDAPDGTTLVTIHRPISLGKAKLDAVCHFDKGDKEMKLKIRSCGYMGQDVEVTHDGTMMAHTERDIDTRNQYPTLVAEGADQALAMALILALVEAKREQSKSDSSGPLLPQG